MPRPLPDRVENEAELEELLSRPSVADVAFLKTLDGDIARAGRRRKDGALARDARSARCDGRRHEHGASRPSRASPTRRCPNALERRTASSRSRATCSTRIRSRGCHASTTCSTSPAGSSAPRTARPHLGQQHRRARPTSRGNSRARGSSSSPPATSTHCRHRAWRGSARRTPRRPSASTPSRASAVSASSSTSRASTARARAVRLIYAVDLRYGTLVDIARKVWPENPSTCRSARSTRSGRGTPTRTRCAASARATTPPIALNVTGPEVFSIRSAALRLGERLGREPRFVNTEGPVSLLGNTEPCQAAPRPATSAVDTLLEWCAHWVESGGRSLGKTTKYQRTDGRF